MPPAGAPWWAFIVTAAAAVIAVIIANSASKAREHESWRREQLLVKILEVLQDAGNAQALFAKISTKRAPNRYESHGEEIRNDQLKLHYEITEIALEFRKHMELLYVMSTPTFSKLVHDFHGTLVESCVSTKKLILEIDQDQQKLKDVCTKVTHGHADLLMIARYELRTSKVRSRWHDFRMKRIVRKAETIKLKS